MPIHDIKEFYFLVNGCKKHVSYFLELHSPLLLTSLVVPVAVQHLSVLIVDNLIHDLVLAGIGHLKVPPRK